MNKAAQKLGRMAAGKPKNFSAAELARRTKRLAVAREKRWPRTGGAVYELDNSARHVAAAPTEILAFRPPEPRPAA